MRSQHNPNAILDECSSIDHALDTLESDLSALRDAHKMYANDDNVANTRRIESQGATLMNAYRALSARVKKVKSSPDSGSPRNAPQVGRVDRRLKKAINDYQRIDSDFRRLVQEMQARQYRIVRPEATDEEVRQACEDPSTQIFQQALLSSSRTQQAQSTLHNVRARHDAIQKIERDMIELAELFQDLDVLVQEQEPLVQNIVQKGEEVNENVTKANDEIGGAIVKARSRNRKKWWCLLICILIVIVIAVVVAVVVVINNQK
ncbi:SNARE domain protein [Lineolata rhizophorae]|uniref:SNARE domain protein n=1 Tax=Lineolata rhizophorae TaxID=578093 RepID=A0A6A6NQ69_9PEZI|nr:SNARE domain protein [Lineolata rhizophorae]